MKKMGWHLFVIVLAVALEACSVFEVKFTHKPFTLRDVGSFKIEKGKLLPIVAATDLDGRNVPFATNRRKIIVVYGGKCEYSDKALNKLSKKREVRRQNTDLIVLTEKCDTLHRLQS